jgi:electron transfer flavoprotein beta subunit
VHFVVPIKQVPETSNVRMDPVTGTMIRAGVGTVVNPLDLFAIELAVRLKEAHGGRITTLTMGPRGAEKALREALAMGCDDGVLVSDRAFAGSDSWSTSYTLAQAIRKVGDFDLIVAGERATDGDTGQVGPGIAAWLGLPLATYVAAVSRFEPAAAGARGRGLTVERLVEEGYQVLDLPLPALVTVVKEVAAPRLPTLRGKRRAKAVEIPLVTAADLEVEPGFLGLKGSPTKVVKVATPKVTRGGRLVRALDDEAVAGAVDELLAFLDARDLLPVGGRS